MNIDTFGHELAARWKWMTMACALALATTVSGFALQTASAADEFPIYDELDSPNPLNATNALVFYKAADLGWLLNGATGVPIADVQSLAYTVSEGTSFAPSFQLITKSDQKPYARLVWEPYLQNPPQGPNTGTFTNLEDGLWWTSKIPAGPGSQSDPEPLSFFANGGGAGWTNVNVFAVAIHQGTTTESTSIVTRVNYNGTDIPLGNAVQGVVATVTCANRAATIAGTAGNDVIAGTPGADVIAGLGGDDILIGLEGDDIICGGGGNDRVRGAAGNDKLKGGVGSDKVFGEAGSDKLRGGAGRDHCNGGAGIDTARKCETVRAL